MGFESLGRMFGFERLHLALATLVGLVVSVVIGLYAVGYGGNPIKSLMLLVGCGLLLLSTISPRTGLKFLLISGAYLDFFKRFLLFFGIGSFSDVLGVLAVAPINLTGVFLGACVLRPIFTKQVPDRQERRLIFLALFLITASLASSIRSSGGITPAVIGNAANQSAYALLVPTICILYRRRDTEELRRLLQFAVLAYLPVAIYGVHQSIFGYSQFEIDYLRSGLSSLADIMYDAHPRPFSTLNSNHAFAVSMGILVLISSLLCFPNLRPRGEILLSKWRWILPVVFVVACLISFGRGGWMVSIIGFICIFAFRTRTRLVTFYTVFALSFGLLLWRADDIYNSLDKLQEMLPSGSSFREQAFRLGTYSERLYGFQNIFKNRAMWTWFGNPNLDYKAGERLDADEIVHDALGQMLISHGIVGILVIAALGSFSLFTLHRRILAIQRGPKEILARGMLGVGIAVAFGGLFTGSHLSVFPINLLFWTAVGVLVAAAQLENPTKEANVTTGKPTSLSRGSQRPERRAALGATGFRPST